MKRICLYIYVIGCMFFFAVCHFSENLTLNEDGSGNIEISFDGSEIMKMAGDKVSEDKKEDVDSLIVFKDFLDKNKDSISKLPKEKQDQLQRLKEYKMHILVNSESKKMNIEMQGGFKKVSELGDILSDFKIASDIGDRISTNKTGSLKGANSIEVSTSEGRGVEVIYSFKKNKFSRIAKIIDKERIKKEIDSLERMKMFLATSKYKLKYSFPRKIKKVSSDKATFSLDMKTCILEVDFMDYMENPKVLDLEIELEK